METASTIMDLWGGSQEVQALPLDVAFWNAAWSCFGMTQGGSHFSGSSLSSGRVSFLSFP